MEIVPRSVGQFSEAVGKPDFPVQRSNDRLERLPYARQLMAAILPEPAVLETGRLDAHSPDEALPGTVPSFNHLWVAKYESYAGDRPDVNCLSGPLVLQCQTGKGPGDPSARETPLESLAKLAHRGERVEGSLILNCVNARTPAGPRALADLVRF